MDNKIQDYLDKKYWFMKQKFSNVSYLTILRQIVKEKWYDLWPLLFDHENWKYETNHRLTTFLQGVNYQALPKYQLANKLLIIQDINTSCEFCHRWIRQWWQVKWFDRKKEMRKLFQQRLQITNWEEWQAQPREQQDFLVHFSIEELQTIYAWGMAFSQVYFLDQVFYGHYNNKVWFAHPNAIKRKQAQLYLSYLLQSDR